MQFNYFMNKYKTMASVGRSTWLKKKCTRRVPTGQEDQDGVSKYVNFELNRFKEGEELTRW